MVEERLLCKLEGSWLLHKANVDTKTAHRSMNHNQTSHYCNNECPITVKPLPPNRDAGDSTTLPFYRMRFYAMFINKMVNPILPVSTTQQGRKPQVLNKDASDSTTLPFYRMRFYAAQSENFAKPLVLPGSTTQRINMYQP
jgi:hypothetical protein